MATVNHRLGSSTLPTSRSSGRAQPESTPAPGSLNRADVRGACTAPSTKKAYKSYVNGLSRWIKEKLLPPRATLMKTVELMWNRLKCRRSEGRSAIWDIYRQKKISLPLEYTDDLKVFFRGMKRIEADNDQNGTGRASGKSPLSFLLYKALCQKTIGMLDNGFAHLYLVLQWNLMCRSKSVETVHVAHLNCVDDSIGCVLHKTKTNQEGSDPKDRRHIYGNPLNPNLCCILAVAIYFASNPRLGSGSLFPGSNEKSRFSKKLGVLLQEETGDKAYGTHLIRKGVATFASSGSTGGPSMASVCLLCGWFFGGVQDRYIQYESAGDKFLGRVVAGLPLDSPDFAVLPPHFSDAKVCAIEAALQVMFPDMSKDIHMHPMLALCTASLVEHAAFLRQVIPAKHPLFASSVFRDQNMMDFLRCKLVPDDIISLVPTGIPPYINRYQQQQKTQEALDRMPNVLLNGISKLLDEKGVGTGAMRKDELQSTIRELLNEAGLYQGVRAQLEVRPKTSPGMIICWKQDGKFHRLPEDFEFPEVDDLGVWHLWWFGNASMNYPPFKGLQPSDFSTKIKRKRYSEWTVLVKHLCDAVKSTTGRDLRPPLSQHEADDLFNTAIQNVPMKVRSEGKASRRADRAATTLRRIREALHEANPEARTVPFRRRKRRTTNQHAE